MKEKEQILKQLDDIEFHDVPVEKISFKTENTTDFIIDFALYQEREENYDYWTLKFIDIKELESGRLELNPESDLEIYSLDYKLNKQFDCKILFLLGFGQSSYEIILKCEKIELNKTD